MALTRDQILGIVDIKIKEFPVPEWEDTVFIRQLTRGDQDAYLKRQYGNTKLKQDRRAKDQEISAVSIYGHDSFLCSRGMCDEDGKLLFKPADIDKLSKKSGAAIGRIAKEILEFSEMSEDIEELDELKN